MENTSACSQKTGSTIYPADIQESLDKLHINLAIIRKQRFHEACERAEKDSRVILEELRSRVTSLDEPQLEEVSRIISIAEQTLKGKTKHSDNLSSDSPSPTNIASFPFSPDGHEETRLLLAIATIHTISQSEISQIYRSFIDSFANYAAENKNFDYYLSIFFSLTKVDPELHIELAQKAAAWFKRKAQENPDKGTKKPEQKPLSSLVHSKEFKKNKAMILHEVSQNGFALKFAGAAFRNDEEIVIAAMKENGLALEFASDLLRANDKIVLAAVRQNGHALTFAPDLQKNREIAKAAIRQNSEALKHVDISLQNDKELAKVLILSPLESMFRSYISSMLHYSKAISMSEEHSSKKTSELYEKTTHLILLYVVNIRSPEWKRRIDEAISPGNKKELLSIINEIEPFLNFCDSLESWQLIADLYEYMSKPLVEPSRPIPSELLEVAVLLREKLRQPEKYPANIIKKYRNNLKSYRENFSSMISNLSLSDDLDSIRTSQKEIFKKFKELFFGPLLNDALEVLGPPPCQFDFLAKGSLAREEMTPFSDLEWMLLIEDNKHIDYFYKLIYLIQLQVIALGESSIRGITTCNYKEDSEGFHLDMGEVSEMIGEPVELAEQQKSALSDFGEDPLALDPASAEHMALRVSLLYSTSPDLFSRYITGLNTVLETNQESTKLAHQRAFGYLRARNQDYGKIWPEDVIFPPSIVSIKNGYLSLINYALADLAIAFQIHAVNTLDIIDELEKKNVFIPKSCVLLKKIVTGLYVIRQRLHKEKASDEITIENLSNEERKLLEDGYWDFLRPFYFIVKKVPPEKLEEIENQFKSIDLEQIAYEEREAYYRELSLRIALDDSQRKDFLSKLKYHDPSHAAELAQMPNRKGLRQSWLQEQEAFQTSLQELLHDTPTPVFIKAPSFEGYLKPTAIKALFDEGNFKDEYPTSAHRVCSFQGFHFKELPKEPLMEYAIHNLTSRIAGQLTPFTELVRFEVEGRPAIPILISKTIPGSPLEDHLKWEECDQKQWTWMILCSILTRPGDGRSANYLIFNKKIFCVDNDVSWVEPIVRMENLLKTMVIQFCAAPFCRFSNKYLDLQALEEFCKLKPFPILKGWIEDVINKGSDYQKLFKNEEEDLYNAPLKDKNTKSCFTTNISLRKHTMTTLNIQFIKLQKYVQESLAPLTSLHFLNQLFYINDKEVPHQVGTYVLQKYRKANPKKSIDEQLAGITSRDMRSSQAPMLSTRACLGEVPTFEDTLLKYRPEDAYKELITALSKSADNFYNNSLIHEDGKFLSINEQTIVIDTLIELLLTATKKPSKTILQGFKALTSTNLAPFLHEQVEYLDLSYCPEIQDANIRTITKKCPNLKELHLNRCSKLIDLSEGVLLTAPIQFRKLTVLQAGRCENLRTIQIEAPLLSVLHINNNPKLTKVDVQAISLESKPKNCLQLITQNTRISDLPAWIKRRHWAKDDKDVVLVAVQHNVWALEYASDRLKDDKEFVLTAVQQDGWALEYASDRLKDDKDVVLAAVQQHGRALGYASDRFKDDKEFVLTGVQHNGWALEYASDRLKDDKDFVLTTVQHNGRALEYASDRFKDDKDVVLAAVQTSYYGQALEYASDRLKDDKEFVLAAVQHNGWALQYASDRFKDDKDVVLAAVQQHGSALEYASDRLKDDKDVVLATVQQNGWALEYASDRLKDDKDVVLATVQQDGWALEYASNRLKDDKDVIFAAEESSLKK